MYNVKSIYVCCIYIHYYDSYVMIVMKTNSDRSVTRSGKSTQQLIELGMLMGCVDYGISVNAVQSHHGITAVL